MGGVMNDNGGLAEVIDLAARRARRNKARAEIVQAANRYRLQRTRYVRFMVRDREHEAAGLLSARHIQLAVAIVRHHLLVSDDVLAAAGFRPARRPVVPAVSVPDLKEVA